MYFMYNYASFDVSNLFTNVPLDETLFIIMDSLFDKIKFKKRLDIPTKDIYIFFNGKL